MHSSDLDNNPIAGCITLLIWAAIIYYFFIVLFAEMP